ncbi:MAG: glycosyltransferase [Microscillaceae bacterium]|jgi:glycogen(starch) synthase|nr:glycosyltransferase [Microscillaceae bacterium]
METISNTLLIEVAWEVCNQIGGIYTVIRSKIPAMMEKWDGQYCALGPAFQQKMMAEFEPSDYYEDFVGKAVMRLREMGYEAHYGRWLVSGKPKVVLLNPYSIYPRLEEIRYYLWEHYGISTPHDNDLVNQVVAFGAMARLFFAELAKQINGQWQVIGHFHEWMTGIAIPDMRRENIPIHTVFTTHATQLGRYLAMNSPKFYEHLPFFNWEYEAQHFNIEAQARIERVAAHASHVFTTVSEVTAEECIYLLGRKPDLITPNGLNLERFMSPTELVNHHRRFKEKIHQFTIGHFFHNYRFNLDNTLYFFTAGRFEYRNKGFDLTLEALERLNWRMQQANLATTVVVFLITRQNYYTLNPNALNTRAVMEEVRSACNAIVQQIGERFFYAVVNRSETQFPNINDLVDEYWQLRLRRTIQSWKTEHLPLLVTHNLVNDQTDEILNTLREKKLLNAPHDRVKVVYHPDFVSPSDPFFGMEYVQFLRGCNLGIFPSYYEPWGYTPLECIASGIPTVTSDLAGFGDYVVHNVANYAANGIYVVNRRDQDFNGSANQLADFLFSFVQQSRKDRMNQRNRAESISGTFDWQNFRKYYDQAYLMALQRW